MALPTTPTQTAYPWRATLRTALQGALALAVVLPLLVETAGVDAATPVVGSVLVVSAAFARVMALPQVEALLQQFVPWLAAKPADPEGTEGYADNGTGFDDLAENETVDGRLL